jgi:ABC-2 type transport system ATP-binding protein
VIETRDLNKKYGELYAVKALTLKLEPGDVFGFIGPNGAGKTTTMRMLATLLNPTSGEAYVCGHSIYTRAKEIRRLIGFMPDAFGVYEDMKVIEYLEFFAAAYRINGAARRKKCDEVLDLVGLGYKRDALATSLSRGMNQRLGLARVLLHDPQVLLLDEPASGLDPRVRIEIRELIKKLGTMGKTIMVSSHILPELADMCNKIGIIERGELLVNADVNEVMRQVRQQVVLVLDIVGDASEHQRLQKFCETHPAVESLGLKHGHVRLVLKPAVTDYSELPSELIAAGFKLKLFGEEEINLETAFMVLTKGITS